MSFGTTYRIHSGAVTTSGNTQATPLKVSFNREAVFFLKVTAISGTLAVEIQTYNRLTSTWHKLAVFSTKSTVCQDEGFIEYGIGEKVAIAYTLTGTATFSMDVHVK